MMTSIVKYVLSHPNHSVSSIIYPAQCSSWEEKRKNFGLWRTQCSSWILPRLSHVTHLNIQLHFKFNYYTFTYIFHLSAHRKLMHLTSSWSNHKKLYSGTEFPNVYAKLTAYFARVIMMEQWLDSLPQLLQWSNHTEAWLSFFSYDKHLKVYEKPSFIADNGHSTSVLQYLGFTHGDALDQWSWLSR